MRPGILHDPRLAKLLEKAAAAYRRRDDAAFQRMMEEAVDRAPQRLDLWVDLASHHIQTGSPESALGILRELDRTVPYCADVLTHLAHWERHAGQTDAAGVAFERLVEVRPRRAADLEEIWRTIDRWLAAPVTDALPNLAQESPAIVVLGYVLNRNGTMDRILLDRLAKALAAADRYPGAIILVTGGVPKAGRVEAVAMREWLVDMGVEGTRIFEEGYARDVAENILYSRQILSILGVDGILCVTSAIDVRRTGAGMEITGRAAFGDAQPVSVVAASGPSYDDWADDGRDKLKLYRDALRAYGLPMMNSYPELAER